MALRTAIGVQDYSTLIENDCFYVDKTSFIKEWWESMDSVTLIARPRRFGKTLNISMTEQFFSLEYAGRSDLFEGKKIWEEEKYRALQGTCPVISLSFGSVKETNYEDFKFKICQLLKAVCTKHKCLLNTENLLAEDKRFFIRAAEGIKDVEATEVLNQLAAILYRYYGKKVIILLDEYDTPMQEAYIYGYWEKMVAFMRSFFNTTFKTNSWLERALMTGITRISKESVFSDLNHLKVVTTTSKEYAESFGFTEAEVFAAMDAFGYPEKDQVKKWYDGFVFGERKEMYNPWSILNFLDTGKVSTHWANTSSNGLIRKLIQESSGEMKVSFEYLLDGGHLFVPIDEQIVYNQLDDSERAIWSLLVASGYLKVVSHEEFPIDASRFPNYELAITNLETKVMFRQMVTSWFEQAQSDYNAFVKALLFNDKEAMNVYMNRVSMKTFSYFDTGKYDSGAEPERFYHGFVLGLIVELGDRYVITSNRESGFGRYDVMLEPREPKDDAFIMEFKVHNPQREKSLEDTVEAALTQIREKKYAEVLVEKGIAPDKIHCLGFAFEGKKVLIG